ncbi:gliding motility lipoprotein GldB [Bacteroidia bacterium]|nr:gliding motility lipoprotein GldB [Bacteroidia bacterium]
MMNRKIFFLFILYFLCFSCTGRKVFSEENPELNVRRFDIDLYKYLNKQSTGESLSVQYKTFLDIYGEQVIGIGKTDSVGFYERLGTFFSDSMLMSLYKDQQSRFENFSFVDKELNPALVMLLKEFPALKQPSVYAHVSGLNQNVVVTDDILSLSLDKYMGADYKFYQGYFYDYQLRNMTPDRIVPDYLLGFMMANFPFKGLSEVLLERMLYEGKLRYVLSRLLPDRNSWEYIAYTKEQDTWCRKNESRIWKSILKNDHLYTPDYMTTARYMNEAPYTTVISPESPGRIGVWVGFQIVKSYIKKHPETSLSDLVNIKDAQQLLKESGYKPQ